MTLLNTKKDERYYKAEGRDNNKELRIDKYGSFTYRTGIGTVKKRDDFN